MKIIKALLLLPLLLGLAGCTTTPDLTPGDDDTNKNPDDTVEYVTVTFDTLGGNAMDDVTIEKGDTFTPSSPLRDGFVFDGWYTDSSYMDVFYTTSLITQNMTLYAKWVEDTPDLVTITFISEYGDVVQVLHGIAGEELLLPNQLVDTFYNFMGWKVSGESGYYAETVFPEDDVTLVAEWVKNDTYTLTLQTAEGVDTEFLFDVGDTITLPVFDERIGYVFVGWYTDSSFTNQFDETAPLEAHDYVLYERWETVYDYFYTVSFQTDGSSIVDDQLHVKGQAVIQPTDPIKKGHIFLGWFSDSNLEIEYHFDQAEHENLTLWAKWEYNPNFTTVILMYPGDVIEELFLDIGERYDLPIVQRDGYIFNWWHTHVYADNYNIYREYLYFAQPLGEELVLHALFTEAPNMVYVDIETFGGSVGRGYVGDFDSFENPVRDWGTFQANPGDHITLYNPGRTGYTFSGWYLDEDCTIPVDIQSSSTSYIKILAPNESSTIYAKWVPDGSGTEPDNTDEELTIIERLNEMGFVCEDSNCTMEESTGYNYTFNLDTLEFSYIISTETVVDGGYRYYDRSITIGPDFDLYYTYYVDENYGFQYYIELELEGNYLTDEYTVTHFYSNVSSEASNVDKAETFIDNLMQLYQWIIDD